MLEVEHYFDLSDFKYAEVFDGAEFVWDVLKNLKTYIDNRVKSADRIRGKVMEGAHVSPDVIIEDGAFVEYGAMIKGPAIIGRGTVIRHGAYIREYCLIGADSVVGHASELKGSIMLNGSQAPHFAYVGDSVLGSHVNLGAGTRLSNMKNDKSPVKIIVDGKEYMTHLMKLGAILGDGVQIGCNTVTNPGTLIGPRTCVYPNSLLRGVYPGNSIIKVRQEQEICKVSKGATSLECGLCHLHDHLQKDE